MGQKYKLELVIDNCDDETAKILVNTIHVMQYLGAIGSSRELRIYADGDGSCRPKLVSSNIQPTIDSDLVYEAVKSGMPFAIGREKLFTYNRKTGEREQVIYEVK